MRSKLERLIFNVFRTVQEKIWPDAPGWKRLLPELRSELYCDFVSLFFMKFFFFSSTLWSVYSFRRKKYEDESFHSRKYYREYTTVSNVYTLLIIIIFLHDVRWMRTINRYHEILPIEHKILIKFRNKLQVMKMIRHPIHHEQNIIRWSVNFACVAKKL